MNTKINRVLQKWPHGTVATLHWLKKQGVDHRLADKYVRSGWLYRLGHGAYMRTGSSVEWTGAVIRRSRSIAGNSVETTHRPTEERTHSQ